MHSEKYALLNEPQKEAVFHTEGPLLILAGAGAGKTRVLTHRIAYLIEEKNVPAYNILAITFTNKAANEMKERVQSLVEFGDSVWVATFHSTCVRILRRFIDKLGYDTDFTIYDTDDQKTVVRHVLKDLNLDPKMYKERAMVEYISDCKTEMMSPKDMMEEAGSDYRARQEALIYEAYEKTLKKNNALDFDDLLLKTVQLFEENEQVLAYWQDRFRYILVDEYQDTNEVQFKFVWLLAKKHQNLCVVGDDDQSIYRFRGADIRNILEFESHFPGTKVVKLEQNYRSTTHILDAANAVIKNNRGRKEKHLWSALGEGIPVHFKFYDSGYAEAEEVIRTIVNKVRYGARYKDFAVLFRTNAQSRLFEERCLFQNIPYQIVGGVNFYQRQEIKDLIAYLKTVAGGKDDVSTRRIINVPRRGIGDTTIDRVATYADSRGLSLMEALRYVQEIPGIDRARTKLSAFVHLIGELREHAGLLPDGRPSGEEVDFADLIREIVEKTDYESSFDDFEEEKAEQKKENVEELISKARDFQENYDGDHEPTLIDFLEDIALVADIDAVSENDDKVLLMTLHSSKGLEFPTVFLVGCEDGLFPSYQSLNSGDYMDVEEERRLCYVGITRAQKELFISGARARTVHGDVMYNPVSRFIQEIPEEMLDGMERTKKPEPKKRFGDSESYGYGSRSSDSDYGYNGRYADDYSERYGSYDDRKYGSTYGSGLSGSTYSNTKKPFTPPKPASFGKTFEVKKAASLDYDVGDRVQHVKFGVGTVLEIIDGKKDYEVAVNFDEYGEKRMFASFAKLKKI